MKSVSAEEQQALRDFESWLPKLWDIALGRAQHGDVSSRQLFLLAAGFLNLTGQDRARALYESSLKQAYSRHHRVELAKEVLKIIRYVSDADASERRGRGGQKGAEARKAEGANIRTFIEAYERETHRPLSPQSDSDDISACVRASGRSESTVRNDLYARERERRGVRRISRRR